MLLTGDIERAAEAELVARNAAALRAEVLLLPHHGSRSSSSMEFLAAVDAKVAIAPVGYRNRFGHPSAEVLERVSALKVMRTDRDGAVVVKLTRLEVEGERQRRRRYWHQF